MPSDLTAPMDAHTDTDYVFTVLPGGIYGLRFLACGDEHILQVVTDNATDGIAALLEHWSS